MKQDAPIFSPRTIAFLKALERNNSRDWFHTHHRRFQEEVQEPVLEFIRAVQPELLRISSHFLADDRKIGGSMLRLQRDMRFTSDPTPYFTHVLVIFRHEVGRGFDAPAFHVRIDAGAIEIGAGFWRPRASNLERLRARILERPAEWKRIRNAKRLRETFGGLSGAMLKRLPKGLPEDHPLAEDLRRKDWRLARSLEPAALADPGFAREAVSTFRAAAPLVRFLCQALRLPF
jgi:uncharacterized protein (TIGR02453 family)